MTAATPPIAISAAEWTIVSTILARHVPGCEVWAFGSRARRTARRYSDLDLAVIADTPVPNAVLAAMADNFSESDLPWKVDIVDWASTADSFRAYIEQERIIIQWAAAGADIGG